MILNGNSLGERQKELNKKVNDAVANDFDKHKIEPKKNDVDMMFLIDLANKHRNIDFVVETLKSGDIVHISRTLNKCTWLSDNEFAKIINVANLHTNVFPFMSMKMKKKLLCMLSTNLKVESRCINFYEYCMQERLFKIAIKFLYNTPESFKNDVILKRSKAYDMILIDKEETLANFIGNSFSLARTFLDTMEADRDKNYELSLLRYMYSISNEQYLSMLEKYKTSAYWRPRFGNRLSKEIIKKHKDNVLRNPLLYINLLNKDKIAKNSTVNDVKAYAVSLLPDKASSFWNQKFYEKYKFILEIIPAEERFSFLKKIFTERYPDEQFEMSKQFYDSNFYNLMTINEKEHWALNHIKTGDEILGSGNDYIWYKFVSFGKAFENIKKIIHNTPQKDKRLEMINVLVDSAKSQSNLETLLNYYYNRHVNELSSDKIKFVDKLIENHNVFEFEEASWTPLEKIFYSLYVYLDTSKYISNYREIALTYYIIKNKTVPTALLEHLGKGVITVYDIKKIICKLSPEKKDVVFQYIYKFYLTTLDSLACEDEVDDKKIVRYTSACLDLLLSFSKTKDDIPDVINKYIKAQWDQFKHHPLLKESTVDFSEKNIKQYMKKDATLVIDEFPLIKRHIQERFGRTNWLFKKLRIYFHHDIAKRYLQLLNDYLSADDVHYLMAQVAVYGILKLADEPFKIEFMQKHVPTIPKIDHANISPKLLNIQQAICGYACVSRPPLPIECVNQYLTGDYVHNCLPMFNYYLMNLPVPACIEFVKSTIDKPVSIQKHGLRLAFQCFSVENLKTLITDIWMRSKNVSLRKILYKSLYDKVLNECDQTQLELFKLLSKLTADLHQDDDAELFLLLSRNDMPNHLKGQYLVDGWKTVKKLPERTDHLEYTAKVIKSIESSIKLVPENEVDGITNDHVFKMIDEKCILQIHSKSEMVLRAKWELTLSNLANVYTEKQLTKNLKVVRHIIKKCLEMWNEIHQQKYVMREFCRSFIMDLDTKSYDSHDIESYSNVKIIYDAILKDLQEALPEHEIYLLVLQLRLSSISSDVIISCKKYIGTQPDESVIIAAMRKCLAEFAEGFVKLIQEYMKNGRYFATFYTQIENSVEKQLERLQGQLDDSYTLDRNLDNMYVLMCTGLLKFKITEVYLLVIRFLPLNYEDIFISDYEDIKRTVKAFQNTEVQYFMFEKFVNQDFMVRTNCIQ